MCVQLDVLLNFYISFLLLFDWQKQGAIYESS